MTALSLSQAAKLTGKSKSTINRAVKSGKISATRHDDGSYSIETSELTRAFDTGTHGADQRSSTALVGTDGDTLLKQRIEALEQLLEREREVTADLKEDRDRWRQQATALLADQRPQQQRNWWRWRRGTS